MKHVKHAVTAAESSSAVTFHSSYDMLLNSSTWKDNHIQSRSSFKLDNRMMGLISSVILKMKTGKAVGSDLLPDDTWSRT